MLRAQDLARLPPGKLAELFALLTDPPVRGAGDLARAGQDTARIQAVSGALSALQPPPRPQLATR
jgi:hypothetical protein